MQEKSKTRAHSTRDGVAERGAPPFGTADYRLLRKHVISMHDGKLHDGPTGNPTDPDDYLTNATDLTALLKSVKAHIDSTPRSTENPARIMLHAHGGLVPTVSGIDYARAVIPWWLENGVYPIFFVWESGLMNTLEALSDGGRDAARDFYPDEIFDPAIEILLRNFAGRDMWTEMKARAAAASDGDGAATLFADGLGSILSPLADGSVQVHAVGHSAGSVFLGHFLKAAEQAGIPALDSVSLLAPAMRVDLFKATFVEAMATHRVKNLSMFTMTKDAEHKDTCKGFYRKSLLYLVSRAFEAERGAAILGLDETVRADSSLTTLFGVDGGSSPASVVWSPTKDGSPRPSDATSHGDFDNDAATMQSVAKGITGRTATRFPSENVRGFDETPAGEVPSGGKTTAPTRKALCIGIDDYPRRPLTGCVADAVAWAEAFTALGFEVQTLTNEQATTRVVLEALSRLVARAREGDVVAVQYSGHGTAMPDLDGDEQLGNWRALTEQALIAHGAALGEVILDDDLAEIWEAIRPGVNVTAFFDSCHAGDGIRGEVGGTGVGTAAVIETSADPIVNVRWMDSLADAQAAFRVLRGSPPRVTSVPPVRAILFSACRPDEVAYESGGNGVFTRAAIPLLSQRPMTLTNTQFAERVGATIVPPRGQTQTPGLWEHQDGFATDRMLLAPVPAVPLGSSVTAPPPPQAPGGWGGEGADDGASAQTGAPESRVHAIAGFLRATATLLESD